MRLIDADAIKKVRVWENGYYVTYDDASKTPTADLAAVIRCKNCHHYNAETSKCVLHNEWGFRENDYCSFAERKEE